MKEGDRVQLVNVEVLGRVGMSSFLGKTAIIKGRLNQNEIRNHGSLKSYEIAWWVRLEVETGRNPDHRYYVPEQCMIRIEPIEPETETRKEQTAMALFAITILKTPSVKAQEAGETETIVVAGHEVVAHDTSAGICLVAAANAEKINALKDEGAKVRVIARNLG